MIPSERTYKMFKCWAYDQVEAFRKENSDYASYHFHGKRHDFVHREYVKAWAKRTGVSVRPPVVSGLYGTDHNADTACRTGLNQMETAELNRAINLEVAKKLGHHLVESGYSFNGK